jgi:hypothetical protein
MRTLALTLALWTGCVSSDPRDEAVDYVATSAVAVGGDVVVAIERRVAFQPTEIDLTRVHDGVASPLSPALRGDAATRDADQAQLAAIDDRLYLSFYSDRGFHGAPLGADDAVDPATIIDLGFTPAVSRIGDRFAAVSFPDHGFSIFLPVDTFHATFVTRHGHRDGDLDVARLATPLGTEGLPPRIAGNARMLALPYLVNTFTGLDLYVARVDATGALLDAALPIVVTDGHSESGDARLTVTGDGGVVVVYELVTDGKASLHATRIEPGAAAAKTDQVIDLAREPSFLIASGDRILAVSAPVKPGEIDPTFETFDAQILDDHGRPLGGPVTVTTGDRSALVIATATGFAVVHSGGSLDTTLTPLDRDGTPGDSVTLATDHPQPLPKADPGGCSSGGSAGSGLLVFMLVIGWRARSARRTDRRIASTCSS